MGINMDAALDKTGKSRKVKAKRYFMPMFFRSTLMEL
jgi:hypothetical protein